MPAKLKHKDGWAHDVVAGLRELLYTRAGSVRFGTARLIGYPAARRIRS